MVVVGQLVAGKRMFFQDQVADFKAASMIQQAKKELWAELIKAMARMVIAHGKYEQPAHRLDHVHAVGDGHRKVENMFKDFHRL